jgi:isopenicillin-N N-acyltransferase like protein
MVTKLSRRSFLASSTSMALAGTLSGCGLLRIDPNSVLIRSDVIDSLEKEQTILSKARTGWTADKRMRVLFVSGTAYERGYQHGTLLRDAVQTNLTTLYNRAKSTFHFEELFSEAYERMRPYLSQEYVDEMHGLAHGSRLPLSVIHAIHALPEMSEWGGKRRIKQVVKDMRNGLLGTSCSNFCAHSSATADGKMYTVRILDWGLHRISRLHEFPLILVSRPDKGIPSAVIGWCGFLGAISGMNANGITLGEMGYGDPPNETLRGKPMPFLLRDVLTYGTDLNEVRTIVHTSPGTNSFVFLMSEGRTGKSEIYIKDHDRFLVFRPGEPLKDADRNFPAIHDMLYGGHFQETMTTLLTEYHGKLTPEIIMDKVIPPMVMKSNFQNVLYDPQDLRFWVANAASPEDPAATQRYTYFDFKAALEGYPG